MRIRHKERITKICEDSIHRIYEKDRILRDEGGRFLSKILA